MRRGVPDSPRSLPAISEDVITSMGTEGALLVPSQAWTRPQREFLWGLPPAHNSERSPPPYTYDIVGSAEGPNGEKLADVRRGILNNRHIAKRGGWKKLCLIALLLILCIVALVVGLDLGLWKKNTSYGIPIYL